MSERPRATPEPRRVEELFARALDLPPDRRSAFVADECADSPAEREAVESLLAVHEDSERDPGQLDVGRAVELLDAVHAQSERTIGPYRIVREIGRGGMGTVYLAERVEGGFEQQVALKLVHPGLGTEAIVERFRQERQILAGLEHPGIARLLDGGVSSEGQPYFAMEYVAGEPITHYVSRHALPVEQRLELFVQVCEAVQRAHGSLVVHRDLKPSNVLVSEEGQVKLVDFGIAKVLEPTAGEAAPPTRIGLHSLTPEYASPEQVRGQSVSTASDVYALGVLLYELLTDRLPYDGPLTSPAEVVQAVCESTPKPPSSTVPALDRDLDAMCLKALAKERELRYGSVEALAEDVRRHLAGLPVGARAPSAAYRARKFIRRHRWGVATSVAAVAALLIGLAGTAWQARVAASERDRATAEAAKAIEVQEFLTSLLQSVDPRQTGGAPWTADELLDRGVERTEDLVAEQPEVAAHLLGVMGGVSQSLGQSERAESLWRRSLGLRRSSGATSREVAEGLRGLARSLFYLSRYDEAEALLDEALALGRQGAALESAEDEVDLAVTLDQLGVLTQELSRFTEAEQFLGEALDIYLRRLGEDDKRTAFCLYNLGGVHRELGELEEAIALQEQAVAIETRILGARHPELSTTIGGLAATYAQKGDYEAAEARYREALAIGREAFGPDHPSVTTRLSNLAHHLTRTGAFHEAAELYREVVRLDRSQLGEDHPYVAFSLDNLAIALAESGRVEEAVARFEEARPILLAARGAEDPHVAAHLMAYAEALRYRGDPLRAIDLLGEARSILVRALGSGHWREVAALERLAAAQGEAGLLDEAERSYREGLELIREVQQNQVRVRLNAGLGRLLVESNRLAEARGPLAAGRELATALLPADHPQRHYAELGWARLLFDTGDEAGARELANEVMDELSERSDVHTERLRLEAKALL